MTTVPDTFPRLWHELERVGRAPSGGYRRFAWTAVDAELRSWFVHESDARGLDVTVDRAGNQWAWWGDPDAAASVGRRGVVTGSHLDSVPDGGAFDGPLGVVSAFAAIDRLRAEGVVPTRPIGVVNFVDEEGARFGVACAGSRVLTGRLDAGRALGLVDGDGVGLAEALRRSGRDPASLGADPEAVGRVGVFVELHVEQGRGLDGTGHAVGVGSAILPHGRWRLELAGRADHAGTTRLEDRDDPMLRLADVIHAARREALERGCVSTVGKVQVRPNGVNAIASSVTAWLDARGAEGDDVRALAHAVAAAGGTAAVEESFTEATVFDTGLVARLRAVLGGAPVLPTAAGHDAGVLASAGVPSAMLFVRNPTGVSHSPAEHAEAEDCYRGITALTAVLSDLAR